MGKGDRVKVRGMILVDDLGPDLVELAFAARLGAFGAEHRTDIIKTERFRLGQEAILKHRTRDGGGHLGTHRHVPLTTVFKREHLLMDDVARLADGSYKKLGGFQNGRANLFETVRLEMNPGLFFDPLPFLDFARKDVLHAGEALKFRCHRVLDVYVLSSAQKITPRVNHTKSARAFP